MSEESTKVGRSKDSPAKAVTLSLPLEVIDEVERMADAQVRARSNMIRVLIHLGMQTVNADSSFAAELGVEVPASGKKSADQG